MKNICVIPVRMGSSRYPNKPMAPILGMPMVEHIVRRCTLEGTFDRVVVATCDSEIHDYIEAKGFEAVMTSDQHKRASDRVQEALENLEREQPTLRFDNVVMVQGDEPLVSPKMLQDMLQAMESSDIGITNLVTAISGEAEYHSPHCVKVALTANLRALFMTRSPIPYGGFKLAGCYKQLGIIGFKRPFLNIYSSLSPTHLEEIESVDMLRVLEHDLPIQCVKTEEKTVAVDIPSDIQAAESLLKVCSTLPRYFTP